MIHTPKKRSRLRGADTSSSGDADKLELVVKADAAGTVEALKASLEAIQKPNAALQIIQAGVGNISKSDVLMARTASRLIVGFNVDVMPKMQEIIVENGVEVRLYTVIYHIIKDFERIIDSWQKRAPQEKIMGKAKVIALFRGTHGKTIIGCEVQEGRLLLGRPFRVITAMGPAYTGKIESLQIEKTPVKKAKVGQQVGLALSDWKKANIGDLVECFEPLEDPGQKPWKPKPGVRHY